MSFVTVEHTNPGAVAKRMERWNHIFSSNLIIDTIERQMEITYAAVYKMAPYKTGKLRESISIRSGKDFSQIGVGVYYAYFLHTGTRGRPMNPFWKTNIATLSIETIQVVRNLFSQTF